MRQRLGAEEVDQPRRRIDQLLHRRVLGVEDAQRVGVQAALGLVVEHVDMALEVRDQRGAVLRAFGGLAQAVEFEPHVRQAKHLPERLCQQDQFGVDVGAGKAERLGADLVELAVAAALRALVAEHRPHVPEALAAVVEH